MRCTESFPKVSSGGDQASLHYGDKAYEIDPVSVKEAGGDEDVAVVIADLEAEMLEAADTLEFERAALLRDQIELLKKGEFGDRKPRKTSPHESISPATL